MDHYWENAGRANNKGGICFAIGINFAQIYPACLQGEDVFPFEKIQGEKAYAIFGDAAAMFRHGVKECCVGYPEKLGASIDKIILPNISNFVYKFF